MTITDAKEFGAAVRARRKELGYTQAFLSDFCGMSVTFISSEVEEMLRTCSRLIVMRDRHVVGELTGKDLNQEQVMKTIAGGEAADEQEK